MQKSTPRGAFSIDSLSFLYGEFLGGQELIRVVGIVVEYVCAKSDLPPCLAEQLAHFERDRSGELIDLLSQNRRRLA